jgi:hypothetical protein
MYEPGFGPRSRATLAVRNLAPRGRDPPYGGHFCHVLRCRSSVEPSNKRNSTDPGFRVACLRCDTHEKAAPTALRACALVIPVDGVQRQDHALYRPEEMFIGWIGQGADFGLKRRWHLVSARRMESGNWWAMTASPGSSGPEPTSLS